MKYTVKEIVDMYNAGGISEEELKIISDMNESVETNFHMIVIPKGYDIEEGKKRAKEWIDAAADHPDIKL